MQTRNTFWVKMKICSNRERIRSRKSLRQNILKSSRTVRCLVDFSSVTMGLQMSFWELLNYKSNFFNGRIVLLPLRSWIQKLKAPKEISLLFLISYKSLLVSALTLWHTEQSLLLSSRECWENWKVRDLWTHPRTEVTGRAATLELKTRLTWSRS